ncbi:hypothetical protein RclHR1_01190009 [Rhizophagus clarus]|uniref:Uncharacterized protein n=1 Tax=Rhizophagus clarus TaxID=94130 RepID=A0A2Z6Q5E7_9GLOM|nr:hypothetical protein RclHR1_01190009 [Rhizophagus clarus]GET02112.1 hypothetical protein GLOIN_2v1477870 [Rhizophagus clarus]
MEMDQVLYPDLSYGDIGNQGGYGPCTEPYVGKVGANQVYNDVKKEEEVQGSTEAAVGMVSEGDNKSTCNQNVKNCDEKVKDNPAQPTQEVKEAKKQ